MAGRAVGMHKRVAKPKVPMRQKSDAFFREIAVPSSTLRQRPSISKDKLMNHLRTNARCQSLIVVQYNGPMETSIELYRLMAAPHWSLTLDFNPAAPLQTWSLSNEVGTYSRGESESLERMASDICNTIMRADQIPSRTNTAGG